MFLAPSGKHSSNVPKVILRRV